MENTGGIVAPRKELAMSLSTSFGFSNTTDSENTLTLKALGLVTNYGKEFRSNSTRLNNATCPTDQPELVTFKYQDIDKVDTAITNLYPPSVKAGAMYGVTVEALASTTDSTDASYRVDNPVVCKIEFRHTKNGAVTEQLVEDILLRAVSALFKADGTSRIGDLMRKSHTPVVD